MWQIVAASSRSSSSCSRRFLSHSCPSTHPTPTRPVTATMLVRFAVVITIVSILCALTYRAQKVGRNGFGFQTTADEIVQGVSDLESKVVFITGGTSGLGKETARVLAKAGAQVFLCGRTVEKAQKTIDGFDRVSHGFKGKLTPFACDLSSLAAVTACGEAFVATGSRLDHLILNAGLAWLPEPSYTPDGFEETLGVNHLAHFHLTNLLMPVLLKSAPARVTVVSSTAHAMGSVAALSTPSFGMKQWKTTRWWLLGAAAYGDSKLANAIHAKELHTRYAEQGVTAAAVHPGEILTGILKPEHSLVHWLVYTLGVNFDFLVRLVLKNEAQGAATQVYAAIVAPREHFGFYEDSNLSSLMTPWAISFANDPAHCRALWAHSAALVDAALARKQTA